MNTDYGCGKQLDSFGYIMCGDSIKENSIPQGTYWLCKACKKIMNEVEKK